MLIYLHGFNSAPASHKAQVMRREMEARGLGALFRCPKLSYLPAEAIAAAEAEIARAGEAPVTLVGSSLGGFYATYLAHKFPVKAVLLNPAVHPQKRLERYVGPQQNLFTGETYELTMDHIEQWRAMDVPVTQPERLLLIVETGDEVLDYRLAVEKYAASEQVVVEGGDHHLRSFPEHIERILRFAGLVDA
jgi:uncharacterized protein